MFPQTRPFPCVLFDFDRDNLLCGRQTHSEREWEWKEAVFGSICVSVGHNLWSLCREVITFTMSLSLLLLLVCSSQASHFFGTLMTYYPKNTAADGSVTVRTHFFLFKPSYSPFENVIIRRNLTAHKLVKLSCKQINLISLFGNQILWYLFCYIKSR